MFPISRFASRLVGRHPYDLRRYRKTTEYAVPTRQAKIATFVAAAAATKSDAMHAVRDQEAEFDAAVARSALAASPHAAAATGSLQNFARI
jgi:cytochrome c556